MNRLWCAVALALGVVGCASEGDAPPWKRPGLMSNIPAGAFDEAIKDARGDNQRMSSDVSASEKPTSRGPTPID